MTQRFVTSFRSIAALGFLFLGCFATAGLTAKKTGHLEALDVTNTIGFEDLDQCILGPDVEGAFGRGSMAGQPLSLPDGRLLKAVGRQSHSEKDGSRSIATLRLPSTAQWNGLPISKVESEAIQPPESDSTNIQRLKFHASPNEVQRTLRRLGLAVPMAPGYRQLRETEEEACGGAMLIERDPEGAALVCSWGC